MSGSCRLQRPTRRPAPSLSSPISSGKATLVRARVREDLEASCERTGAQAPVETPDRDYRFRTSVPSATLGVDLAAQVEAIDYPNFEAEVAARQGHDRARRYGRIWSVMHELQEDAVQADSAAGGNS